MQIMVSFQVYENLHTGVCTKTCSKNKEKMEFLIKQSFFLYKEIGQSTSLFSLSLSLLYLGPRF